jgi:hypothetical protein
MSFIKKLREKEKENKLEFARLEKIKLKEKRKEKIRIKKLKKIENERILKLQVSIQNRKDRLIKTDEEIQTIFAKIKKEQNERKKRKEQMEQKEKDCQLMIFELTKLEQQERENIKKMAKEIKKEISEIFVADRFLLGINKNIGTKALLNNMCNICSYEREEFIQTKCCKQNICLVCVYVSINKYSNFNCVFCRTNLLHETDF